MFIQPQPPHRHISALCVFAFTPVSVFFFFFPRRDTVCVCCMNTAQRLVCEVTDSFITVCAHRETAASTRRREEDRDVGQAGFTVGPVHVSSAVSGREGWENRGQLLSLLMSTHFFHQLSIYRPVLHSCTPSHPATRTWKAPRLQVIHKRNSQ